MRSLQLNNHSNQATIAFIILACFVVLTHTASGQLNIAPNNSFEEMTECPAGQNQYPLTCVSWNMVSQSFGGGATSDYFNACGEMSFNQWGACAIEQSSGVPQNCVGYQMPRTGNGYCGFLAYVDGFDNTNYKEYVGAQLIEPMQAEETYCVEFFVSLADSSRFAVAEIAAFFGPDSLPQVWVEPLNLVPQVIYEDGVLDEKEQWVRIFGYHTAVGNEKFMFIGSYNEYENTTITSLTSEPLGNINVHYTSYYYVDDVSVCKQQEDECACLMDSSVDSTDTTIDEPIAEVIDYTLPNVFTPNNDGVNDFWLVNFLLEGDFVVIFNRWGQEVARLNDSSPVWDGTEKGRPLSEGVYFYYAHFGGKSRHGSIYLYR